MSISAGHSKLRQSTDDDLTLKKAQSAINNLKTHIYEQSTHNHNAMLLEDELDDLSDALAMDE